MEPPPDGWVRTNNLGRAQARSKTCLVYGGPGIGMTIIVFIEKRPFNLTDVSRFTQLARMGRCFDGSMVPNPQTLTLLQWRVQSFVGESPKRIISCKPTQR